MAARTPFRVIEGGLAATTDPRHRSFAEAWVTNSRLMGVLAMGIHWSKTPEQEGLWQYFYFDCEEYGFDRYEEYEGSDINEQRDIELSVIGGLGSVKVGISQTEAVFLFRHYLNFNRRAGIELPEGQERYMFLAGMDGALSQDQQDDLFARSCVKITSQTMLANYYMMRCAGKDQAGARYLSNESVDPDLFPGFPLGTLYRNVVRTGSDGTTCTCESLIEANGYHLVVTQLYLDAFRVIGSEVLSSMAISDVEAQMILNRSEYITLFRYTGDPSLLRRTTTKRLRGSVITEEHNGRTFMIFQPDNRHVERSPYLLYNDLYGVYHIEGNGELLVAANSAENIHMLEIELWMSSLTGDLTMLQGYQFTEPVLGHYLESTFPTFAEFVEAIQR